MQSTLLQWPQVIHLYDLYSQMRAHTRTHVYKHSNTPILFSSLQRALPACVPGPGLGLDWQQTVPCSCPADRLGRGRGPSVPSCAIRSTWRPASTMYTQEAGVGGDSHARRGVRRMRRDPSLPQGRQVWQPHPRHLESMHVSAHAHTHTHTVCTRILAGRFLQTSWGWRKSGLTAPVA